MVKSREKLDKIIRQETGDFKIFSEEIGYSMEALYGVTSGRTKGGVSKRLAQAINKRFPKYDIKYLMTDGMDETTENSFTEPMETYQIGNDVITSERLIAIEVVKALKPEFDRLNREIKILQTQLLLKSKD